MIVGPSSSSKAVDAVLLDLGTALGVAGLRLDGNQCCQLSFQGRWVVTLVLHPQGDRLVLHCPISTPGEIAPSILMAMLQGNFMGGGTGGASLAISPDLRACIQRELPLAGASGASIRQAIEHLLVGAELWALRLRGMTPGLPARSVLGAHRLARHA